MYSFASLHHKKYKSPWLLPEAPFVWSTWQDNSRIIFWPTSGSWQTYSNDKQSLIAEMILCIYSVKKLKKC